MARFQAIRCGLRYLPNISDTLLERTPEKHEIRQRILFSMRAHHIIIGLVLVGVLLFAIVDPMYVVHSIVRDVLYQGIREVFHSKGFSV